MTFSTADMVAWIGSFMWPFLRFSAMMLVAPFFGARSIPVRIRVVLAFFLALLVAPTLQISSVDLLSPTAVLMMVQQVLIGILLGVILQAVFASMAIAGQTVATSMGLGFASAVDPQNGIQVTMVGQFYLIVATLIFLSLNGHLVMIEILAGSFKTLPLNGPTISLQALWHVVVWCGEMFVTALLISLPVVVGVLMVNLALGVITRTVPQLNIFAVGFPITILAGIALLLLSLPTLEPIVTSLFSRSFGFMGEVVNR
jgi:flagellar biosynthetic protein FliR